MITENDRLVARREGDLADSRALKRIAVRMAIIGGAVGAASIAMLATGQRTAGVVVLGLACAFALNGATTWVKARSLRQQHAA